MLSAAATKDYLIINKERKLSSHDKIYKEICSSWRGELAIRSWGLKGVKGSFNKRKGKSNHEMIYFIIVNILLNLNSCNMLCRYYQKVLSILTHNICTFSFNFDNPATFFKYFFGI